MCFLMANRLFQGVIHQMKDSIDRVFGVVDDNYTIIACSELGKIGENLPDVNSFKEIIGDVKDGISDFLEDGFDSLICHFGVIPG